MFTAVYTLSLSRDTLRVNLIIGPITRQCQSTQTTTADMDPPGPSSPKKRKLEEEVENNMGTIELVPVTESDDEEDAHEYTDSDDDVDSAIDVNEEFEVEAYVAAENHMVLKMAHVILTGNREIKTIRHFHTPPGWNQEDLYSPPEETGPGTSDQATGAELEVVCEHTTKEAAASSSADDETEGLHDTLSGNFGFDTLAISEDNEKRQSPKVEDERKKWKLNQTIKRIWLKIEQGESLHCDPRMFEGPMGFVLNTSETGVASDHNAFFPWESARPDLADFHRIAIHGAIRFDIQMTNQTALWKITQAFCHLLTNITGGCFPQDLLSLDLVDSFNSCRLIRKDIDKMLTLDQLKKKLEPEGVDTHFDTFRVSLIKTCKEGQAEWGTPFTDLSECYGYDGPRHPSEEDQVIPSS